MWAAGGGPFLFVAIPPRLYNTVSEVQPREPSMMSSIVHPSSVCSCCGCSPSGLRRRGFLGFLAATAAAGSLGGHHAQAADPGVSYDAMLLSCIDPRMVQPVFDYMAHQGLTGKYSQVVLAGAAVAVVAPTFEFLGAGVLGQPRRDHRAAPHSAARRDRPPGLWRGPDRLWRERHCDAPGRNGDPSPGFRGFPRAGSETSSAARGRDRADGARRNDREDELAALTAPSPTAATKEADVTGRACLRARSGRPMLTGWVRMLST